jgi:cytochrome P450
MRHFRGIALTALLYFLLKNPSCLEKVREELDSQFPNYSNHDDGSETIRTKGLRSRISFGQISSQLPYFNACMKEAFRLHPAPGFTMERVTPPGGATICGQNIPAGVIVGCNAWTQHHNPDIFGHDAHVFRPERWLKDDSKIGAGLKEKEDVLPGMERVMFQFGAGSHTCIGKNISLLEVSKCVLALVQRFEVSYIYLTAQTTKKTFHSDKWLIDHTG